MGRYVNACSFFQKQKTDPCEVVLQPSESALDAQRTQELTTYPSKWTRETPRVLSLSPHRAQTWQGRVPRDGAAPSATASGGGCVAVFPSGLRAVTETSTWRCSSKGSRTTVRDVAGPSTCRSAARVSNGARGIRLRASSLVPPWAIESFTSCRHGSDPVHGYTRRPEESASEAMSRLPDVAAGNTENKKASPRQTMRKSRWCCAESGSRQRGKASRYAWHCRKKHDPRCRSCGEISTRLMHTFAWSEAALRCLVACRYHEKSDALAGVDVWEGECCEETP